MSKKAILILIAVLVLITVGFWFLNKPEKTVTLDKKEGVQENMATDSGNPSTSLRAGLQIEDIKIGTGNAVTAGDTVVMHYSGTLTDGTKFDSSYDRGTPFTTRIGVGQVIQGWDMGVPGMKIGGKRKLTIPSALGYGESGAGGVIPPNATLVFEVELLEIK